MGAPLVLGLCFGYPDTCFSFLLVPEDYVAGGFLLLLKYLENVNRFLARYSKY